jgi:hypothetical protein
LAVAILGRRIADGEDIGWIIRNRPKPGIHVGRPLLLCRSDVNRRANSNRKYQSETA